MWREQASALQDRFRIVLWDVRGHGDSPRNPEPCSVNTLADEVVNLLDALHIPRAIFVGSSIGGLLGMALASRHADRLIALVVCNSTPYSAEKGKWDERIARAQSGQLATLAKETIQRWMPSAFRESKPAVHSELVSRASGVDADSYASLCRAVRDADLRVDCRTISIPTLVIGSALDVIPLDEIVGLSKMIPGAKLHIMPGSGHLPSVDDPKAFNKMLETFISRFIKDPQT